MAEPLLVRYIAERARHRVAQVVVADGIDSRIPDGRELHRAQGAERLGDLLRSRVRRKRIRRHHLAFAQPRARRRLRRERDRRRLARGAQARDTRLIRRLGWIGERQFAHRGHDGRRIAMEKLVADEIAVHAVRRIRQWPIDDAGSNPISAQQLPDWSRTHGIRGEPLLLDQSEAHQRLRETEVRQQIQRLIRSWNDVPARRVHAGLVRQLPGCDRRPHGRRLSRAKRCEVHHGAAVEEAAEVRESPAGRIRGDDLERCPVEQNHVHARARLRR
jgi:hypothetical protein